MFAVNCIKTTKIKNKRPGMAHLKKIRRNDRREAPNGSCRYGRIVTIERL